MALCCRDQCPVSSTWTSVSSGMAATSINKLIRERRMVIMLTGEVLRGELQPLLAAEVLERRAHGFGGLKIFFRGSRNVKPCSQHCLHFVRTTSVRTRRVFRPRV